MRYENLRKERDISKQVESRLNQEKESILAEQRGQNLLLANLKSIQVLLWSQVHTQCWVLLCKPHEGDDLPLSDVLANTGALWGGHQTALC